MVSVLFCAVALDHAPSGRRLAKETLPDAET